MRATPAGRPTQELAGDRPKERRAPTQELDRPPLFFNTVGNHVFILTLAVTCPRSCVAVVQWFGAWYSCIGRHWDGLSRAYLSLFCSSPSLSSSVYFSLPIAAPGAENSHGTVPSRSTDAEGISYIPWMIAKRCGWRSSTNTP